MSKDNVGGAAFPTPHDPLYLGMSLRDYFAAKAMQGMLACEMLRATEQEFAYRAYMVADAMLKARNQ